MSGRLGPGRVSSDQSSEGAAALPQDVSLLPSFTLASLPAAGTAGRLARVTDDNRGHRDDTGTIWSAKGRIFYAEDFDISPERTAAQNDTGFAALITALPANGATVILPPGTINFSAPINFLTKRVNFIGAGREATILATTATTHDGINNSVGSRIAHLTLRGPNVVAAGFSGIDSGSVTDAVVEDVIIEQWGDHGINTGGSSARWIIRNNIIRNNILDGLLIAGGSTDCIVEGNIVTGNGANGIDVNGSRNIIRGNVVRSNGGVGGAVDRWGILIAAVAGVNSDYNLVSDNLVSASGSQNIIVKTTTGQTANFNAVRNNTAIAAVSGNGDGIAIDGSSAGTLRGNSIIGNTVQGNGRHGIFVDGSVGTTQETVVVGNISIGNTGTGLLNGSGTLDTLMEGNTVLANTAAQITNSGTRGVEAGNKSVTTDGNFRVSSNVFFAGIVAWGGGNGTGAGSAALGANSPAVTLTAPYTWIQGTSSDGSTVYFPVWK